MGSPNAEAYLASPAVVAASAIAGYITGPRGGAATGSVSNSAAASSKLIENTPDVAESSEGEIIAGFPQQLQGRVVLCLDDNINTDGIYPGKYTYREDISPEQQAEVVMIL